MWSEHHCLTFVGSFTWSKVLQDYSNSHNSSRLQAPSSGHKPPSLAASACSPSTKPHSRLFWKMSFWRSKQGDCGRFWASQAPCFASVPMFLLMSLDLGDIFGCLLILSVLAWFVRLYWGLLLVAWKSLVLWPSVSEGWCWGGLKEGS